MQKRLIKSTTAYYWTNSKKSELMAKSVCGYTIFYQTQQCVAVKGTTSSEAQVRSGVPHGSVLGPLLFLIHISDIN